jgi:hypothetical protein
VKNFWLLLVLALALGTTLAWAMNYAQFAHRSAFFGEITTDGSVTALNVMQKLKEYHSDSTASVELQSDPTFDFGVMGPGSNGSHEFVIKNVGNDALKLTLGASTCKCTLGSLKNDELAPGESTSVELEWTISGDKSTFEQSAELRTNDPFQPAILLTVTGLVIREIEFDPKQIPFGEVSSGEPFEVSTKMYSYFDEKIEVLSAKFGSEELTSLADFEFDEFQPSEDDGVHKRAKQGFLITAKIKPGLRQGPMVTELQIKFKKPGKVDSAGQDSEAADLKDGAESDEYYVYAECAGRVLGALTMLESSKLRRTDAGGYIWNLGRVGAEDPLEFRSLLALKGSERDNTNLTIGETYPSDVVQAEFGAPLGRGSMRLYPLILKLKASEETTDLLGKNKDDFGWVWIESDNPKVSRMKVAVKALIEPRP